MLVLKSLFFPYLNFTFFQIKGTKIKKNRINKFAEELSTIYGIPIEKVRNLTKDCESSKGVDRCDLAANFATRIKKGAFEKYGIK